MKSATWERTQRLTRGMWIAGIGLMMIRNRILPDALFLIGAVRLVEAFHHPERSRSFRAGVVLIALGLLVAFRASLVEILVIAAVASLIAPMLKPSRNRKPFVDVRLE